MEEADIMSAATKKELTKWVKEIIPRSRPGDFNQAMMELGATVCLPNGQPKCDICPVAFFCKAFKQDRIKEFPVKRPKQPRKIEERTVLLLLKDQRIALRKRPDSGLLAGLWEFPNYPGQLTPEELTTRLKETGYTISNLTPLKKARHIFTHIEWDMTGYLAYTEDYVTSSDFEWMPVDLMRDSLTVPSAFKAYSKILMKITKEKKQETEIETETGFRLKQGMPR